MGSNTATRMLTLVAPFVNSFVRADECPRCFNQRFPATRPDIQLRWLHFPKCGLNFQETLYRWACPGLDRYKGTYAKLHAGRSAELPSAYCDRSLDSTMPGHPPTAVSMLPRTVAMFREPKQRIISAYRDNKHSDGLQAADKGDDWTHLDAAGYARHPGITGCYTRMLQSGKCARAKRITRRFNATVAAAYVNRLAFVGLVEFWTPSICLFHAIFGGRPNPVQFSVRHSSRLNRKTKTRTAPPQYNASSLLGNDFTDWKDDLVYAAAQRRFAVLLHHFAPECVCPILGDDACRRDFATDAGGTPPGSLAAAAAASMAASDRRHEKRIVPAALWRADRDVTE